jgi:hypothetical protein
MITGGVGWGTGSAASHILKSPQARKPATGNPRIAPEAPCANALPGYIRAASKIVGKFSSPAHGEVSPSRHGRFSVTLSVIANQTRLSTEPPRRRGVTSDSGKLLVSTPLTPRCTFRGEEARLRQRPQMSPDESVKRRPTRRRWKIRGRTRRAEGASPVVARSPCRGR